MAIPALRYADCEAALRFPTQGMGFDAPAVHRDAAGAVMHAELRHGDSRLMIGPVADTPFGAFMVQPEATGGCVTAGLYLVVGDAQAHRDRAAAAGAEILLPVEDQPQGGRAYALRDPGGPVWSVGEHAPRA